MKKIETLDQLKELARDTNFECLLLLNGGLFSRKTISYDPEETDGYLWNIFNHIDDSTEAYDEDEEFKENNPLIFEAIEKGALVYDPENCFV